MSEGLVVDAVEALREILRDIDGVERVCPFDKGVHVAWRGCRYPAEDGVIEPSVRPVAKSPNKPSSSNSPGRLGETDGTCLARDLFVEEDCFDFLPY